MYIPIIAVAVTIALVALVFALFGISRQIDRVGITMLCGHCEHYLKSTGKCNAFRHISTGSPIDAKVAREKDDYCGEDGRYFKLKGTEACL